MHFENEGFYEISQKHKRRGWFLHDELKKRSIKGIQPGLTKHFKINTYGPPQSQIEQVVNAFQDIAEKYELKVE